MANARTYAPQPIITIAPPSPAPAAPLPTSPPLPPLPPPPAAKSPKPQLAAPADPARRPSLRERFRSSFPGLAARLSGSSRGSGRSRVDPVLPRTYTQRQALFNAEDMLAPRRARQRPRSAQHCGPPLPPPTQPLPPTPTSAPVAEGGVAMPLPVPVPVPPVPKEREREAEAEGKPDGNAKAKPKPRPLPPVPEPKTPPPAVILPIVLRPNRLGEPVVPSERTRTQHHQPRRQEEEEHQQEAVLLLAPRRWGVGRGSDGSSPPPYPTHPYAVARAHT